MWFCSLTPALADFTIEIPLSSITSVDTAHKVSNPRNNKKVEVYSSYLLVNYLNEEDEADGVAIAVSKNKTWAEEIKRFGIIMLKYDQPGEY